MPNLITTPQQIALNERQELVQFIGRTPSWLMRFGITAIAIVVAMLLTMSYFIKYPDIVTAKVILTTENPPIRMLSKTGGRVSDILIKNNQTVAQGQVLCVMDNTADWHDVLKLETKLKDNNITIQQFQQYNLGVLQSSYSTFTQNLKDYPYFLEKNGVLQKIYYLNRQIESLKA